MANITRFGSISGIDIDNPTSFSYSFVFNKAPQLSESPLMNPFVVSGSLSDIAQIFHYNNASCFNSINYSPTNIVVGKSHKPCPSATYLFKFSLSRLCAFSLQFTYNPVSLLSERLNIFTKKSFVRSDSKVIYSDINAENLISMDVRAYSTNVFRETKQKETSSFFVNPQKTFSNFPFEILNITRRNCEGNLNSTFDSSQTENVILHRSRTREIIPDRSMSYDWLSLSFLDHSTGLFNTGNSELALQSSLSQGFVDKRMEFNIVSDFPFPSLINTELQSFSINLQSPNYLWSCINPNFSCCSYIHSINYNNQQVYKGFGFKQEGGRFAFLPQLKLWVSCKQIL